MNDDLSSPSAETDGDDPASPEPEPWRPSWRTWVAVGLSAAVIGAAAVFGISAATSSNSSGAAASSPTPASGPTGGAGTLPAPGARPGNGSGGFGTIAGIDGSNLTVEEQSGTTTKVVTSSSTSITKSVSGTVDDIKVGDTVRVAGTGSSSRIAATRVTDDGKMSADAANQGRPGGPPLGGAFNGRQAPGGPGGGAGGGMTRGVVQSVGDGTFTITGIDGSAVNVTTSSSTQVSVVKTATLADLRVGDTVMVRGPAANGTITATSIRAGVPGGLR